MTLSALRAEVPTPWPAPGESCLLSAVCLKIYQGPLKRTEPLCSQPRSHGFKTRCTLRWVSCRLLYLEFKVDFLLHFSPALDLLCAWLPREQLRLRQCIPPRSLALLIVRPSFLLPSLLKFFPSGSSTRPFSTSASEEMPPMLVSDNISLSLSEERPFIFKMTTDLFLDKFSVQF